MKKQKGFTPLEVNKIQWEHKQSKPLTGFTIIELLIVIAIIGVLAAIVLINVTGYINKGKDAAAKGDMSTLFTNAITFYNDNSNFDNIAVEDDDYSNVIASLQNEDKMGYTVTVTCGTAEGAGTVCPEDSNSVKWCASIQLKAVSSTTYYCVDSTGKKKESETAVCTNGLCPD